MIPTLLVILTALFTVCFGVAFELWCGPSDPTGAGGASRDGAPTAKLP